MFYWQKSFHLRSLINKKGGTTLLMEERTYQMQIRSEQIELLSKHASNTRHTDYAPSLAWACVSGPLVGGDDDVFFDYVTGRGLRQHTRDIEWMTTPSNSSIKGTTCFPASRAFRKVIATKSAGGGATCMGGGFLRAWRVRVWDEL